MIYKKFNFTATSINTKSLESLLLIMDCLNMRKVIDFFWLSRRLLLNCLLSFLTPYKVPYLSIFSA
jgi:hypothetical protein